MLDVHLSLDVEPHPRLRELTDGGILISTLTLGGDVQIDRNLNTGDQLTVTIGDADGTVIATLDAVVVSPSFHPIKDKVVGVIGTERRHRAKLGETDV